MSFDSAEPGMNTTELEEVNVNSREAHRIFTRRTLGDGFCSGLCNRGRCVSIAQKLATLLEVFPELRLGFNSFWERPTGVSRQLRQPFRLLKLMKMRRCRGEPLCSAPVFMRETVVRRMQKASAI